MPKLTDFMRLSRVTEYILAKTGILYSRQVMYQWAVHGIIDKTGRNRKLKAEKKAGNRWYTTQQWVDEFISEVS